MKVKLNNTCLARYHLAILNLIKK